MDIGEFLLARIAEDEAHDGWHTVECGVDLGYWATGKCTCHYPDRVFAECDAKRRIVDRESRWRRVKPNVSAEIHKGDWVCVTWLNDRGQAQEEEFSPAEYRERFTEPSPPSDTLKFLALPHADHPDYDPEWKP